MRNLLRTRLIGFLGFAVLLLTGAWTYLGIDLSDTIRETFSVRPGGQLHLDIDRGNITVETGQGEEVRVEVERVARTDDRESARELLESHQVDIEKRSNDVYVQARHQESSGGIWKVWRSRKSDELKVHVRVRVPMQYNLQFETGAGNVQVADLEGDVSGSTGAGNLTVGQINGAVQLSSGAGNIEVGGAARLLHVETGAGNVKLNNVQGATQVETGAGNIMAVITGQPDGASEFSSGAGNVTVYLAGEIGLQVHGSTGIGSYSTDFPLTVESGWVGKSFEGTIGSGGPALHLSAGMGNVALKKQ